MLLEKVIAFSVLKPANSSSQLAGSQPNSAARNTVEGRMGACALALPNRSATMAVLVHISGWRPVSRQREGGDHNRRMGRVSEFWGLVSFHSRSLTPSGNRGWSTGVVFADRPTAVRLQASVLLPCHCSAQAFC